MKEITSLADKIVQKATYVHGEIDNEFIIVFTDGTTLKWGYEDGEGSTEINGEYADRTTARAYE